MPPLQDIVDDPAHHRGVLREAEHPVVGRYRSIAQPVVYDGSGQAAPTPAPLVAEHTDELLAELGFDAAAIDELVASGAVQRSSRSASSSTSPTPRSASAR